jgi:hypothetical protein
VREYRSGSQILFGYLPGQTVDLAGRVWRVRRWNQPVPAAVDDAALREELVRMAGAWEATGNDGDFVRDLRRGAGVRVLTLNVGAGVFVEAYPRTWICKSCFRVESSDERRCECGARSWGQFHFVGYHECGALREAWIPRCPQHNQARIRFPGTASAAEIAIDCPVCGANLRRGLGMPNCDCGNGRVTFTVHRAASVYASRSVVIVNPPTPERIRELREAGGATRALQWVVGGMTTRSARELGRTRAAFLQNLIDQGFSREAADQLTVQALNLGQLANDDLPHDLGAAREEAESQAVKIALATFDSRLTLDNLLQTARPGSEMQSLYTDHYRRAFDTAGLVAVEFVDRFPVLTASYGYTRGDSAPGASRLVAFRDNHGQYVVYGDVAQTEALFVRLQPQRVATWLERRGFALLPWHDDRSARLSLIHAATIPPPGSDPPSSPTVGSELLSLVHSLSHRFIRRLAVHAGLDRNSLSEFLVPLHLGFFVFAAARGGFVLGGLQSVFETELATLLDEVVFAEHRCALDPGCEHAGGACAACLHLGEPSCRWFNRFLDRRTLHGRDGYFSF